MIDIRAVLRSTDADATQQHRFFLRGALISNTFFVDGALHANDDTSVVSTPRDSLLPSVGVGAVGVGHAVGSVV